VTARRGRRRKQMLDDFKETGVFWELKEEAFYLLMDRYVITIIYEAYLLMKMSYLGTDL
jgi:hypothetical protein